MFDLTGASLAGYLLRVTRDIASRHPRFRKAFGDAAIATNNQLIFGDVQVIVKDISSDGNRLSSDYFLYTQTGRAIATQVADKLGSFLEWANEIDSTGTLLDPGVYYLNVDWVKESILPDPKIPAEAKVGDIAFTIGKFKWRQGYIKNAQGTKVVFAPGIDATTVTPYTNAGEQYGAGGYGNTSYGDPLVPLQFQAGASFLYLLTAAQTLIIHDANGNALTPNVDYWIEANQTQMIAQDTLFGVQDINLPSGFLTVSIINQDDYVLRPGIDYTFTTSTRIRLAGWTPAGSTLYISGLQQLDPTVAANLVNAENTLDVQLLPGESIVPSQVFISTQDADHIQVTPAADGTITLANLLPPGGWCRYEVRIDSGETRVLGRRNSVNKNLIPGLWIAVGDLVTAGDQAAIVVSPVNCETYEVYGSKENVHATIDIKSNDLMTSSTLAEMLREFLLISGRDRMEADGLTIFEAPRSYQGQQRDNSGTAPTFTYSLSVSAAADWRVFKPLVTRVTSFDITPNPTLGGYPGQLQSSSRYAAFGVAGFLPDYR